MKFLASSLIVLTPPRLCCFITTFNNDLGAYSSGASDPTLSLVLLARLIEHALDLIVAKKPAFQAVRPTGSISRLFKQDLINLRASFYNFALRFIAVAPMSWFRHERKTEK
ncbi:hypothetical protein CPC08DRAFT_724416 [Agrocybe pediades]|nr:hypothetical protein CPC08DRAFT_724416 [Agrocybe pediades]